MPNLCTNKPNNRRTLLQKRPGKHSPQRGGVNCKGQRLRVEKIANIRYSNMELEENASWDFTGNTIVKIERGLVGT